jgi:hypothetical protein
MGRFRHLHHLQMLRQYLHLRQTRQHRPILLQILRRQVQILRHRHLLRLLALKGNLLMLLQILMLKKFLLKEKKVKEKLKN